MDCSRDVLYSRKSNSAILTILSFTISTIMLILYILWLLISLFFFISDILYIYKLMYQQKAYEYIEGFILLVLYGFLTLYWAHNVYIYTPLILQTIHP